MDWERRFSAEGRAWRMPSLQSIVASFGATPGMIGLHGGLPPASAFPFSSMAFDLQQPGGPAGGSDATEQQPLPEQQQALLQQLRISEPLAVATAQQYIMKPLGHPPLQAWAKATTQGLHRPASPLEVAITPGASAALDALARLLLNPGDPVLVEQYSYSHHLDAHLLTRGCELLPVPMDSEGVLPDALQALLLARQAGGQRMPRVLYTIPTGQNPTGATQSAARMAQVYALAAKWDLVVIEDDAYYWLQFPSGSGSGSGTPAADDDVPGVAGLKPGYLSIDTQGRVLRVDTFAKLLGPGFRLGWVSGPPTLVNKLALHTAAVSVGACSTTQVVLHELLQTWGETGFERFVAQLQRQYSRQARAAQAAAAAHLADVAEWQPVTAGMFLWVRLKDGSDASFLLQAGRDHGVMVVPGYLTSAEHLQLLARHHYRSQQQQQQGGSAQREQQQQPEAAPDLPPCPFFRVSFASVPADQLDTAFARLRQAIDSRAK